MINTSRFSSLSQHFNILFCVSIVYFSLLFRAFSPYPSLLFRVPEFSCINKPIHHNAAPACIGAAYFAYSVTVFDVSIPSLISLFILSTSGLTWAVSVASFLSLSSQLAA